MLQRRDLLKLTAGGLAAGIDGLTAPPVAAQTPPPDAPPYTFANVVDLARTFAKRPFGECAGEIDDVGERVWRRVGRRRLRGDWRGGQAVDARCEAACGEFQEVSALQHSGV